MGEDLALIGSVLVALTLPLLLGAAALSIRRGAIRRPGGAVTCSLRRDQRWHSGVAAYRTDQLAWFPAIGFGLRPDLTVARQSMRLVERRLTGPDVPAGTTVARFEAGADTLLLAMSPGALTGLLAWIEAAPQRWSGEGVLDRPL